MGQTQFVQFQYRVVLIIDAIDITDAIETIDAIENYQPSTLNSQLLLDRVKSKSAAEFLKDFAVHFAKHHRGMHLTSIEQWQ